MWYAAATGIGLLAVLWALSVFSLIAVFAAEPTPMTLWDPSLTVLGRFEVGAVADCEALAGEVDRARGVETVTMS
jgi:hypothetical protein